MRKEKSALNLLGIARYLAGESKLFSPCNSSCFHHYKDFDMYVLFKKLFSGDFIRKNRELHVNLTILAGFFAITRSKIIAATFRKMEKTRLDELYIYVDKNFLLK